MKVRGDKRVALKIQLLDRELDFFREVTISKVKKSEYIVGFEGTDN